MKVVGNVVDTDLFSKFEKSKKVHFLHISNLISLKILKKSSKQR